MAIDYSGKNSGLDLNGNFVDKLKTKVKNAVMTLFSKNMLIDDRRGASSGKFSVALHIVLFGVVFFFFFFSLLSF